MNETKKGLPGLKTAREGKMTQAALARALSVPERNIARWEGGESSPSVWAALAIAQALGTTVEALCQEPGEVKEKKRAKAASAEPTP